MNEDLRNRLLSEEKYFRSSWSHIFYRWKMSRIMLGRTVQDLLRQLSAESPVRVIDIGCGPGTNLFEIYDVCADLDYVQWFGLDLNLREAAMGASRSSFRVTERGMRAIHFIGGDVLHLPLPDASVDIIVSSEVVEHHLDPRPALTEMVRILKPGGYALITTPNPRNLLEMLGYALDSLSRGALKRCYWKGQDNISAPALSAEVGYGHVSVQAFGTWKNWLEEVGLPVVRKIRGPMIFGGPFFDRNRFVTGLLITLDPLIDLLPGRFWLSINLGMLCRKNSKQ